MGRRGVKPIIVTVDRGDHAAVLGGPVRVVHRAIQRANCPWHYDSLWHAYEIPADRFDEVAAAIADAGHRVDETLCCWPQDLRS